MQLGDIIFEKNRAEIPATPYFIHHVMIIEGIYEETHMINGKAETFQYIRTIEATSKSDDLTDKAGGVVYGVLDDQRFDYTDNLSIYELYNLSTHNPLNADVAHNKMVGGWYYFYNHFYALVKLENDTYRYATYLRFHGSFSTAVAYRNGYGLNYDYHITAEAKEKYGKYYNNIIKNQTVDYGIDWLNQHTTEKTLIVYSKDIAQDVSKLNQGTETVAKGYNDNGQYVYCIL